MSLILEALKKSEAKRRLGAAPDLGTPFSSRRRRGPIVPVIVIVLIAAGVVWWAVRRAPTAPTTAAQSAAQPAARPIQGPPAAAGQRSGIPLHSVTGNNNLEQTPPPVKMARAPTTPPPSADGSRDPFVPAPPSGANGDPATRMSMREMREKRRAELGDKAPNGRGGRAMGIRQPPPGAPISAMATQKPVAPATAKTVAANPPAAAAAPPLSKTVAPPSAVAVTQPPTPPKAVAAPPATPVATRAPKTPGTIGLPANPAPPAPAKPAGASAQPYSELSFAVRKALPELRLSMHVYMPDPAQRFVILNDSRLGEGEKTTDDVVVSEIRPDGVVLEFQGQRFFYPRDGL